MRDINRIDDYCVQLAEMWKRLPASSRSRTAARTAGIYRRTDLFLACRAGFPTDFLSSASEVPLSPETGGTWAKASSGSVRGSSAAVPSALSHTSSCPSAVISSFAPDCVFWFSSDQNPLQYSMTGRSAPQFGHFEASGGIRPPHFVQNIHYLSFLRD